MPLDPISSWGCWEAEALINSSLIKAENLPGIRQLNRKTSYNCICFQVYLPNFSYVCFFYCSYTKKYAPKMDERKVPSAKNKNWFCRISAGMLTCKDECLVAVRYSSVTYSRAIKAKIWSHVFYWLFITHLFSLKCSDIQLQLDCQNIDVPSWSFHTE